MSTFPIIRIKELFRVNFPDGTGISLPRVEFVRLRRTNSTLAA